MTGDRRRGIRDRRVALRVPAVFAVKSVVRGREQLSQAENLGPGGMTLRRLPDLPALPGSPIVLTFALPGEGPLLRAPGVVVADDLAGTFRRTGVRFAGLAADVEHRIARFCEAQLSDFAGRDQLAPSA
jgi:c-di-GMP-binding flagellar brake protein YcgR